MPTPSVLVLRAPGTNCDHETEFAFQKAGAHVEKLHINQLRQMPERLQDFQILALPGGFSYGDDVASGRILASQLEHFLADSIREFRDAEKLILGICNGFQVLVKAGLIMPADEDGPLMTLTHNESGKYEDRWVNLAVTPNHCPFLKDIQQLEVPVAHGEGNVICRKEWILQGLAQSGQVVMRYSAPGDGPVSYPANPNGSQGNIAGLCDATGRVFGLMPHPERHVLPTQHPRWTREGLKPVGDGFKIFQNAVDYFR